MPSPEAFGRAVGSLHDDLADVADVSMRLCRRSTSLTLWVDHLDIVYCDPPRNVKDAPADWIVGTYGPGATAQQIEADLERMREEHCEKSLRADGPSQVLAAARSTLRLGDYVDRSQYPRQASRSIDITKE